MQEYLMCKSCARENKEFFQHWRVEDVGMIIIYKLYYINILTVSYYNKTDSGNI